MKERARRTLPVSSEENIVHIRNANFCRGHLIENRVTTSCGIGFPWQLGYVVSTLGLSV